MRNLSPGIPSLPCGETHVWLAWTDRFASAPLLEACRALLSEQEAERRGKFHFERDRHLYLVSHAMVRRVLSGYLEAEPWELEFTANAYGRPEVVPRPGMPGIRFNLSHTHGLAAVVVNRDCDCGVDVETYRRLRDLAALAASVLSPAELGAFEALPEVDRRRAFLCYWTLKEAHVKAQGKGLSMPLNRFSFDLGEGIRIRFHAGLDDDPGRWQFAQSFPGPEHALAVAIRHGGGRGLSITYRELAPSALAPDACIHEAPEI